MSAVAESHLLSGLKALRAERLGRLLQIEEEIERLQADAAEVRSLIDNIDAVLKHVEPDIDLEAVKPIQRRRPPDGDFKRSGKASADGGGSHELPVTQHALRILRVSDVALTADDVIARLMAEREGANLAKLNHSVRHHLSAKVKEQLLRAEPGEDGRKRYSIIH